MTGNADKQYQERILKVMLHIQNHLDDTLSLENLADIAHFSPYHFHRIFTACSGESIKSYLRRLRLERATRDLRFTDLSLPLISERAGYETQQSFHRAFKETFNLTPIEFRESKLEALQTTAKKINSDNAISVSIQKIEPITVAFSRHIGSYNKFWETWMQLAHEVSIAHVLSDQTKKISILHDAIDITPNNKLRYDACVSINGLPNFKENEKTRIQTLRGGKYAVITHHGAIEKLESTYQILFGIWLPNSGYEPDDCPNFVLHRTLPINIDPELLLTDIYLPIK